MIIHADVVRKRKKTKQKDEFQFISDSIEMNSKDLEEKVKSLVHKLRFEKGYVCSVDVLMGLDYLSKIDYENWRFGRVAYLEKVCKVNLSKLTSINLLIRKFSKDLNLKESFTLYKQFGKGPKRLLRFSKTGIQNIEDSYSIHYIDLERIKVNASAQQRV